MRAAETSKVDAHADGRRSAVHAARGAQFHSAELALEGAIHDMTSHGGPSHDVSWGVALDTRHEDRIRSHGTLGMT